MSGPPRRRTLRWSLLLDLSLDPNGAINDGRTAFMGAAMKGRNDTVLYADGLVRVGVQSAVEYPETSALIRKLMEERKIPTPPKGPQHPLDLRRPALRGE